MPRSRCAATRHMKGRAMDTLQKTSWVSCFLGWCRAFRPRHRSRLASNGSTDSVFHCPSLASRHCWRSPLIVMTQGASCSCGGSGWAHCRQNPPILTAPIPLTYSLTSTRPCGVPTSLYYESGAPLHSCRGRVCAVGWGHLTQLSPCMSECLQSQTLPLHSVMQTEHRLLHG